MAEAWRELLSAGGDAWFSARPVAVISFGLLGPGHPVVRGPQRLSRIL